MWGKKRALKSKNSSKLEPRTWPLARMSLATVFCTSLSLFLSFLGFAKKNKKKDGEWKKESHRDMGENLRRAEEFVVASLLGGLVSRCSRPRTLAVPLASHSALTHSVLHTFCAIPKGDSFFSVVQLRASCCSNLQSIRGMRFAMVRVVE